MLRWSNARFSQSPNTILYPLDYLPTSNDAQMHLIDALVENVECVLGVKETPLVLKDRWAKAPGAESDMSEYLKMVCCAKVLIEIVAYIVTGWVATLLLRRGSDYRAIPSSISVK